jgi:hypothetical protein
MNWTYQDDEVQDIPAGFIGFIYCITYEDGKQYIGKKLAKTNKKLRPLKGMRKNAVRREEKNTNWKSYTGSSKIFNPSPIVKKEILMWCKNKTELSYWEAHNLFLCGALFSDDFLNQNILGKFYAKDLINEI